MTTEREIQAAIFRAIGGRQEVRLFRNNVGAAWMGKAHGERDMAGGRIITLTEARRVEFGLHPGSPDLVGVQAVVVTPAMVGQVVGRFVGLEVKAPGGRLRPEQANFLAMLGRFGAAGGVVRNVAEAEEILGLPLTGQGELL